MGHHKHVLSFDVASGSAINTGGKPRNYHEIVLT